jgi:hypothetical protein
MTNKQNVLIPEQSRIEPRIRRRDPGGRLLFATTLVVLLLLSSFPMANAAPSVGVGVKCRRPGELRGDLICRVGRDGKLAWRRPATGGKPTTGVTVVDGLPFERTLAPGLTPREVAFQFAKDWTALMACLDWGPDNHNISGKNELGPITSKCNKAVWGTPNAFIDWWVRGRLTNEQYYAPVSVLWEKYTSYGATLRHTQCPAGSGWDIVCTGLPSGYWNWYEGRVFTHHIFYDTMRVTYGQETWIVHDIWGPEAFDEIRRVRTPGDVEFDPVRSAEFAHTPLEASYWEYPGCRLIGTDADWSKDTYAQDCTVYWAFQDLSGRITPVR